MAHAVNPQACPCCSGACSVQITVDPEPAYFDTLDVCEAHYLMEVDYNVSGWLAERPSNRRRQEATHVQLDRMGFRPRSTLTFDNMTENGQAIYRNLERRYGFRTRT